MYFNGQISDIRIYSRISDREIRRIYHYTRVNYLSWYHRLLFWTREAWLLLVGKEV